jgi:hypothetical protein
MGKLHDLRPQSLSMLFSYFSVIESLVSSHHSERTSVALSHSRFKHITLFLSMRLIDQDGSKPLRLNLLLIRRGAHGACPYAKKCG